VTRPAAEKLDDGLQYHARGVAEHSIRQQSDFWAQRAAAP
jgi:hypothetical protein